jgi:hypothetical protein
MKRNMGILSRSAHFAILRRKLSTLLFAGVTAVCITTPALASFSGPYDPSLWTTTLTGNPPGGGWPVGVDASAAPDAITIVGGDSAVGTDCWDDNFANPRKGCAILFMIEAAASGAVSFAWSYESFDNSGTAYYDVFGYVIDGVPTQLTDSYGGIVQNGTASFNVAAGQSFGFWLDCGDCGYYEAMASVRDFQAPLPEPTTVTLFSLGLASLAAARRRRTVS